MVIQRIGLLAKQLGTSKKTIIERAIKTYADTIEKEKHFDVLEQTLGAWQRDESPQETIDKARSTFSQSMERHQQ